MDGRKIVIKAENISKRYRIGVKEKINDNLAITVLNIFKKPLDNYRQYRSLYKFDDSGQKSKPYSGHDSISSDIIWALKDVSFEVKKGERIGIIGGNGAGKSTLLKILSKITTPTTGYIKINGSVSSLLEVGTGFHPELTGRENVYLNGAILGLNKKEIAHKFDEIVEFSGVEKFIDTPVKRYSSGMVVRLAFAVASNLDSEILIIDEVLAVGDINFQKKCLGKMESITREGDRTILFVSHSMGAVQQLCTRAIMISEGSVVCSGSTEDVISRYMNFDVSKNIGPNGDLSKFQRNPDHEPVITRAAINGKPLLEHHMANPLTTLRIKVTILLPSPMRNCTLGIHFNLLSGTCIYGANTRWVRGEMDFSGNVPYSLECKISDFSLAPGQYYLSLGFSTRIKQVDFLERVSCIEVARGDVYGTGHLPYKGQGYFLTQAEWKIEKNNGNGL